MFFIISDAAFQQLVVARAQWACAMRLRLRFCCLTEMRCRVSSFEEDAPGKLSMAQAR